PVRAPGQRRLAVPGAAATAGGAGILAGPGRHEHDSAGGSGHGCQVVGALADRALRLPHRVDRQHADARPDAGEHGPGLGGHPVLAAADPAGDPR
nr:hypothetical protein [Tanacetum cinerariifolium]